MSTSDIEDEIPDVAQTGKVFWRKERAIYSDWKMAIFREFFQNSVDAGSKNVRITISEEYPKSFFGRPVDQKKVARIIFDDDGCGMNSDILKNVYFKIGETTKTDSSTVGGFGRARVLTCLSQVRYGIETLDCVVEGDGGEYKIYSHEEAPKAYERWATKCSENSDVWSLNSKDQLLREAERVRESGFKKGCRVEVDVEIDDVNYHDSATNSVEALLRQLRIYLVQSDVPCDVYINGDKYNKEKVEYSSRRKLSAVVDNSMIHESFKTSKKVSYFSGSRSLLSFAKVGVAKCDNVPTDCRNRILVRVNGATMFSKYLSDSLSVCVDVDPEVSRLVLTANRDGMKKEFEQSLDDFYKLLSTDTKAALTSDEKDDFKVVYGGKGSKLASSKDFLSKVSYGEVKTKMERLRNSLNHGCYSSYNYGGSNYDWENIRDTSVTGVNFNDIVDFFDHFDERLSLLPTYFGSGRLDDVKSAYVNGGLPSALREADGSRLGYILEGIRYISSQKLEAEKLQFVEKMASQHDIPILKEMFSSENFPSEFDLKTVRRIFSRAYSKYDPLSWDVSSGVGLKQRKLLSAWSIAVDSVVGLLYEQYPTLQPFKYSCGWVFSPPVRKYDSFQSETVTVSTEACAHVDNSIQDNVKVVHFLLNPLDIGNNFNMAYNMSDPDHLDKLIALAIHEVPHAFIDSHNDSFASLMTSLTEKMTMKVRRKISNDIKITFDLIDRLYKSSKIQVVSLGSSDEGNSPTDRLMSHVGIVPEHVDEIERDPSIRL